VISFAAKLRSGQQFLGVGLSSADLLKLKAGEQVVLDLASVGVGLWIKEADGSRTFLQPRDSHVLIMAGDSPEDVGALLQVDLSSLRKT
jgi:hypothetical protein